MDCFLGIHGKLDHLLHLNTSNVWLNSFFKTTEIDTGADAVTDYMAINPQFGTMKDFEDLRIAMHKKGRNDYMWVL